MYLLLAVYLLWLSCIAVACFLVNFVRTYGRYLMRQRVGTLAFFHPYCDAGGGGERVLWRAVATMQYRLPQWTIVIYTDDYNRSDMMIVQNAQTRFDIRVDVERIIFVRLKWCWMLQSSNFATMLIQLTGGFLLGLEALWRFQPMILIDTVGAPTILPVFKYIGNCQIGCYIHYPMITNEMIELVLSRTENYNNLEWITNNTFATWLKAFYYYDILQLYSFCIASCDVIMTNGTWTNNHILTLKNCKPPMIVYPPCDVQELINSSNTDDVETRFNSMDKRINILSVGQIRPEKDHLMQLAAFAEARKMLQRRQLHLTLTIAGGVRGLADQKLFEKLKQVAANNYNFINGQDVLWMINAPIRKLRNVLHNSLIGIHTMRSEHFGISVVEGMAAGNIMLAHNSGGPLLDIIGGYRDADTNPCGFLAATEHEYAEKIVEIVKMNKRQRDHIRKHAQLSAERFDNSHFDAKFIAAVTQLVRDY